MVDDHLFSLNLVLQQLPPLFLELVALVDVVSDEAHPRLSNLDWTLVKYLRPNLGGGELKILLLATGPCLRIGLFNLILLAQLVCESKKSH